MIYNFETLTIGELIKYIENDILDLSPSYQREFIWSLNDQKSLIDTIYKEYPLPNLFINSKPNGKLEMVDGQQRSRSIYRFYKKEIKFSNKDDQRNLDINLFLNYRLPVVFIKDALDEEIRDFYVLINKKGKFLNNSEVQRSEFLETNFLKLSEELISNQDFINLDLFTDNSILRLNNRDFVQELLGYLFMFNNDKENRINEGVEGLRDKKAYIETEIFQKDISESQCEFLKIEFLKIIKKISKLDQIKRINTTRYKQRNDFYTLFTFLNKHSNLSDNILKHIYSILILLDGKDKKGNQFIRPTNEECECLKKYAQNCVTQSNSKIARKARLDFFENILLNEKIEEECNEDLLDLLVYLGKYFGEENLTLKKIEKYYLIDLELLRQSYEF